ncbi:MULTISPECIES: acylneuraminate cytidylyltransferase family protein [unclassified Rhizobium]|uniref:acylneuraminate cytidylyltransferase family protein n=1 Tax=unclassified Rhizobium TaxID=2613769 RepID=UPI001AE77FF5|nr:MULTISPECIES: acylneuraminate cytidylyltransferase family protein [unclassified Rhizobium]MBP2460165.1 CMP-N-acetylneuraminic acid synthetase [Rhizobium sp. PvP014]MBP2531524.1 CMP-N-acetylneuraminic acid synthetase [Rhizobium sp. PvP099]
MRTLAIIPARGGSVRLPRKNILNFMGKPLIQWTVEAALESGVIDKVVVNTDDQEIADAGLKAGAEIPFLRPPHLATTGATTFDVVKHALETLDVAPDYVILLQPTSPLRNANDIREAFSLVDRRNAPAVVSVSKHEMHWSVFRNVDEQGALYIPTELQSGGPTHCLNGAIYIERREPFLRTQSFTPPGTLAYVMPQERSVDIDTAIDFKLAEALALDMKHRTD